VAGFALFVFGAGLIELAVGAEAVTELTFHADAARAVGFGGARFAGRSRRAASSA
jgi:hypothetical protein